MPTRPATPGVPAAAHWVSKTDRPRTTCADSVASSSLKVGGLPRSTNTLAPMGASELAAATLTPASIAAALTKVIAYRGSTLYLQSLPLEVFVIRPAEIGNDAARAKLDDPGRESAHEFAVVRDEDERAGIVFEADLQRLDGLHVHVVGGLVHQEHVGFCQHELAVNHAPFLAPGQNPHGFLGLLAGKQ